LLVVTIGPLPGPGTKPNRRPRVSNPARFSRYRHQICPPAAHRRALLCSGRHL